MILQAQAGYSGTPLVRKLGFKPGWRGGLVRAPDHCFALLDGAEGIGFKAERASGLDTVDLFLAGPDGIGAAAALAVARLRKGGVLWVSWAKKSSPRHAGVTEDRLRRDILPLGWVDVKVCAVDADWSALKFVERKT